MGIYCFYLTLSCPLQCIQVEITYFGLLKINIFIHRKCQTPEVNSSYIWVGGELFLVIAVGEVEGEGRL